MSVGLERTAQDHVGLTKSVGLALRTHFVTLKDLDHGDFHSRYQYPRGARASGELALSGAVRESPGPVAKCHNSRLGLNIYIQFFC